MLPGNMQISFIPSSSNIKENILLNFQATGALEEHRRMREYLRRMERDGVQRVKMFLVITGAYVLFWGPLFFVTLVNHPIVGNPLGHEVIQSISLEIFDRLYFSDYFAHIIHSRHRQPYFIPSAAQGAA